MGYTVYFSAEKPFPRGQLASFQDAVKAALVHPSAPLTAYEYDAADEPAIVEEGLIRFNGIGDRGHETFVLLLDKPDRAFCKTAAKPYTVLALAVLGLANYYAPGWCSWSDDGKTAHHDVADEIVQDVLASRTRPMAGLQSIPLAGPWAW